MHKYDVVILKAEFDILADKGICGGCFGTIVSFSGEDVFVLFQNKANVGDYAFATVHMSNLLFCQKYDEEALNDFLSFLKRCDRSKNAFKQVKLAMGDRVVLIVDKHAYSRYGVKAGMQGVIVTDFAVRDKWSILFDIFDPNSESDDILVDENDLSKL